MKRKDECLFCSNRKCYTRIAREEEPRYDEIACNSHILELERHSDEILGRQNGIMRWHITGNSQQKRHEELPKRAKGEG